LNTFLLFILDLVSKRNLIFEMTKREIKSNYIDSFLGIIWAFLNPIALTFIFWFVFQIGYGLKPVQGYPYIVWLVCGLYPWLFFNEGIVNGTSAIVQNSFIVKKVHFRLSMLPLVKILSALTIHLFFITLIFFIIKVNQLTFSLYNLQVIYYLVCMLFLMCGMTWLTSAVVVFFKDLRPMITIILQILFYMTPIFWLPQYIPERFLPIINYNPVYYIVQGYRDSFVTHVWFWEHWQMSLYFWFVAAVFFVGGAVVFRRLRPHFADVM